MTPPCLAARLLPLCLAVPLAAAPLAPVLAASDAGPPDAALRIADGTPIAPDPAGVIEPENLATFKAALTRYHDSTYPRDLAAVDAAAQRWIDDEAGRVPHPAVVLDIDETALSNWPEIKADDYGFIATGPCATLPHGPPHGPCGFGAWERLAAAPAIAPTVALAEDAERHGVAVFFVTGRKADVAAPTAVNLRRAGYHDWQDLILEPVGSHFASAADFKAPARAGIEARGYTIVATIGDQMSDLSGGHALRGFKLPNPFYHIP